MVSAGQKTLGVNSANVSKYSLVFFINNLKNVRFRQILHQKANAQSAMVVSGSNVGVFYTRGNSNLVPKFCLARKVPEKRVFCEHAKFGDDFWREHFKIFGVQKANKTFIFGIEESEAKNLCGHNSLSIR